MYGQTVVPVTSLLSEYQAREVAWLWPGRVPIGRVTLLCGDPGVGKSFVMADMAARVTAGLPWPEEVLRAAGEERGVRSEELGGTGRGSERPVVNDTGPSEPVCGGTRDATPLVTQGSDQCHPIQRHAPGSVLIMSGEDDPFDTLRPRIEGAGGDTRRVVLLRAVQHHGHAGEWVPELDRHADMISTVLKRMERPRLVVIDPVTAFMGRANASSNAAVRDVLDKLADIAAAWRVAVVCVTHLNKSASARAMYRVMGSLAFAASPRMVWRIERSVRSDEWGVRSGETRATDSPGSSGLVGAAGEGSREARGESGESRDGDTKPATDGTDGHRWGEGRGEGRDAAGTPTSPEEPGESVARGSETRTITRLGEACHQRSVMRAVKSNLGGVAGAIGFRIVGEGVGRVVWERAGRAEDPTGTVGPPRCDGALEEACAYLEEVLRAGPRNAAEVVDGAGRVGISVGTLRRAKGVLGVVVRREREGWVWGVNTN